MAPEGRYQYPVLAAFANGHRDALEVILGGASSAFMSKIMRDSGFGKPAKVSKTQDPLTGAAKHANCGLAEYLSTILKSATASLKSGEDIWLHHALLLAAEHGAVVVVRNLLDQVVDISDETGQALEAAARAGQAAVVELVLSRAVKAADRIKDSCLQLASELGHEAIVRLMLKDSPEAYRERRLAIAFQAACKERQDDLIRVLLKEGAMTKEIDLQTASYQGHDSTVRLLLDHGIDPIAKGGEFGSALRAASLGGHETVIRTLINRGADVNSQTRLGTALQAASEIGHEGVVQVLLSNGAEATARTRFGTALQFSSRNGQRRIVQMLRESIKSRFSWM